MSEEQLKIRDAKFLEHLKRTRNISAASREMGFSRQRGYQIAKRMGIRVTKGQALQYKYFAKRWRCFSALEEVKRGVSIANAARHHNVPLSTLRVWALREGIRSNQHR